MIAMVAPFALAFAVAASAHPSWPGWGHGGSGGWGSHGHSPYNKTHPWRPSQWGNTRSPCPALNTLANEGLLPYSGRNITTAMTTVAFKSGFNFATDFITDFTAAALAQCSTITNTTCTSFDLDMLNVPHMIEHDGSLSRQDFDYGLGDNHDFSPAVWGQVMEFWGDAEIINLSLAESARVLRMTTANRTDVPGWFLEVNMQSMGETSFYLAAFGDAELNNTRKDWVHYFFSEERFPYHLGWNATQRPTITAADLEGIIAELAVVEVTV